MCRFSYTFVSSFVGNSVHSCLSFVLNATYRSSSRSPSQSPRLKQSKKNKTDIPDPTAERSDPRLDTPPGSPPILGSTARRKKQRSRLSSDESYAIATKESARSNASTPQHTADSTTSVTTNTSKEQDTMSVTSSDFSSTEESSVDLDTSISPTPDSPTSVIASLPDTPKMKNLKGRRALSNAASIVRKETKEDLNEDVDSPFTTSLPAFRSRIATFGGQGFKMINRNKAARVHPTESAATNETQPQANGGTGKTAVKLQRRNSYPLSGQQSRIYDVDLLSPDMEMKMQQIIFIALTNKYGGKEKATKAATIIQTAYRKHKNVQHFKELRKRQQSTMQRRRTMSIKFPGGRRPSMISRKNRTTVNASIDKMTHVKTVYKNITQPKLSPNISRRELHATLSPVTSKSPLCIQETASVETEDKLEGAPVTLGKELPSQLSMIDEVEVDVEMSDLEKTYSEKRDNNAPSQSIFSGLSSSTIQKMFSANHPIIIQQKESASTFRKKTIVGANIFNRYVLI